MDRCRPAREARSAHVEKRLRPLSQKPAHGAPAAMKATRLKIPDLILLEPKVFGDARGFFLESYNRRVFKDATGLDPDFVQDNHSRSAKGVLRGLHYQIKQSQAKLVRVIAGEVFDVAVDIRRS